jgi:hypothetical protein
MRCLRWKSLSGSMQIRSAIAAAHRRNGGTLAHEAHARRALSGVILSPHRSADAAWALSALAAGPLASTGRGRVLAHALQVNILIDVNVVDTRNPWKVVLAHRPAPIMVSAQTIRALLLQPSPHRSPQTEACPAVRLYDASHSPDRTTVPTVPLGVLRPLRRRELTMRAVL